MKTWLATLATGILLLGCKGNGSKNTSTSEGADTTVSSDTFQDKAQASAPTEGTGTAQGASTSKLDPALCKEIEKKLPNFTLPYKAEAPVVGFVDVEPFPSEIQSWIEGPYQELSFYPIGKLRYSKGIVWLIGGSNPSMMSSSVHALLVDENCEIKDRLEVAFQISYMSTATTMNSSSHAVFKPDGTITIYEQSASYSHHDNTSQSGQSQKRYKVDFERMRFLAL